MPRFFVNATDIDKDNFTARIFGEDARHIARSLRMAVGDKITVTDGEGCDYPATLTKIRDDECELDLGDAIASITESPLDITLYMAYPKGDKLETVVQKAVELGACSVVPFISDRCIKRPTGERADRQTARLNRIAIEAAKQCGRGRLPTVSEPLSFDALLDEFGSYDLTLFCFEGGTLPLNRVLKEWKTAKKVAVIVGSEGGFSENEAKKINEAGAVTISLGKRILRCETAPSVVLSALLYEFEL